jgi:hypothetical protein
MKKNILLFCCLFILTIFCTACSNESKTNSNLVDSNIDANKILFLRTEYGYFDSTDNYYVILTVIDNSCNMKVLTLELSKNSTIIKNINDPVAMLLAIEEVDEKDLFKMKSVKLENLKKAYNKTFDIKDKLSFSYKLLEGEEIDTNYNNYLYGFSYLNNEDYVVTKYFSSNKVSTQIKDSVGVEIAEYLYSVFR